MILTELRNSCLSCVRKHLAQALVAMQEALQGYPENRWVAIGHMGEASDEALQAYPSLANEIRDHRVSYMADPGYVVPIMMLIAKASALIEAVDADSAVEASDFPSKFSGPASQSNRSGMGTAPPDQDPDGALKIVQDGPDDEDEDEDEEESVDDLPEPHDPIRRDYGRDRVEGNEEFDYLLNEATWEMQPSKTAFLKGLKHLRKTATGRAAGELSKVLQAAAYRAYKTGKPVFIIQATSYMSRVFELSDDPIKGLERRAVHQPTIVLRVAPDRNVTSGVIKPRASTKISPSLGEDDPDDALKIVRDDSEGDDDDEDGQDEEFVDDLPRSTFPGRPDVVEAKSGDLAASLLQMASIAKRYPQTTDWDAKTIKLVSQIAKAMQSGDRKRTKPLWKILANSGSVSPGIVNEISDWLDGLSEDVLVERNPTEKELKSGKRPEDVSWKDWLSAGGSFGKSKPKPKKSKESSTKSKKDDWWGAAIKGLDTFDDDDWAVPSYGGKGSWSVKGGYGYKSGHSYSKSKYVPPAPKLTPDQEKVRKMARGLGKIARIAAGGIVVKDFSAPDVWDLQVVVSKLHPRFGSKWFFPKGGLDVGEAVHSGAAREVAEESGVKAKVVSPLAFKHTAVFGDRGRYDLPLALTLLKQKYPEDVQFIDDHVEEFKGEYFTWSNKSHYFVMIYKSGTPFPGPDPHQETAKSEWVTLREAVSRDHRMYEAVKFLLPVIAKMWEPTLVADKQQKPRVKMLPKSSSHGRPRRHSPSGNSKDVSLPWSGLNLF